jgi:hypothetical protein
VNFTFEQARQAMRAAWPDYRVADYGYETDAEWLILLLPETAGGRIAAVSKDTGEITWINENAEIFSQERPVGNFPGRS